MSAGHVSSGRTDSTASWLDPESNNTSRMFISFSNADSPHGGHVSPGGRKSTTGRSYHEWAPWSSKMLAACRTSSELVIASPHRVQSTAGMGTPHARWREMHQSGRLKTMLEMRSCPHDGTHFTS